MRVLMLLTDAFGGHGGIAKFNRDFLRALCRSADVSGVIALPRLILNQLEAMPEKLVYIQSAANSKYKYLKTIFKMLIQSKKERMDLIVCGHINLLPFAWFLKCVIKVKIVLIVHGIEAWAAKNTFFVNAVDEVISVSVLTRERFCKWSRFPEKRVFILPNNVELNKFKPEAKNSALIKKYGLENKKILMAMGRLSGKERYKGFDEVLSVMPGLLLQHPQTVYMIIGDGNDRVRLEKKAERLGIAGNVVFAGFVAEDEKADYLRLADIFVMPGYGEGFGIVFLEAMACGVSVIGSKIDGSREALDNGRLGTLVNPLNQTEIQTAILEGLKEKKTVTHSQLQQFSYQQFERNIQSWLNTIKKS